MAEKEPKFVPEKEIDVEKLVEKWGPPGRDGYYTDVGPDGRVLFRTKDVQEWVEYQVKKAKKRKEE